MLSLGQLLAIVFACQKFDQYIFGRSDVHERTEDDFTVSITSCRDF